MESSNPNSMAEEKELPTTNPSNEAHDKRRRIGFFLIGIGAFLCVFGFLITMVMISQGANFNVALYGATGVGGVSLFGGLVAVMG